MVVSYVETGNWRSLAGEAWGGREGEAVAGTATDGGKWSRTHLGTSKPRFITQRATATQTSPRAWNDGYPGNTCV